MKVNPLTGAKLLTEKTVDRVHSKDSDEGQGFQRFQQQKQDQKDDAQEHQEHEVTEEAVSKAMTDLGSQLKDSHQDLHAEMAGKGPGLKVVLKDGRGAVVRQLTGEEFLKLREAIGAKGRLFDKKF